MSARRDTAQVRAIFRRLKSTVGVGFEQTPEALAAALGIVPRSPTLRIGKHRIWRECKLGRIDTRMNANINFQDEALHVLLILHVACAHDVSLALLQEFFGRAEVQVSKSKKGWWSTYDPPTNGGYQLILIFDVATKRVPANLSGAMIVPRRKT